MAEARPSWAALLGVAGLAIAASVASLWAAQSMARSFDLAIYLVATAAAFVDLLDMVMRLYLCRGMAAHGGANALESPSVPLEGVEYTARQKSVHLRPYAIIASIHNAEAALDDFLEAMEPYREHTWLIDDASTDLTCVMLRQAGWRCVRAVENAKKPGALRALLVTLPPEIETVMVIDPDIEILAPAGSGASHLEAVLFDFQRSAMAAACPRIAIKEDGFLSRFQALEYCMAFSLGRRSLADNGINSGISIYRRADLEKLLDEHSLSVYAEDFENSILLLDDGQRIYYDGRLVIVTDGKRTWREWFSQRVGWHYGLLRVFLERFAAVRRVARGARRTAYQYLVYTGIFTVALQPVKVAGLALLVLGLAQGVDELFGLGIMPPWAIADPAYAIGAYVKYTLLAMLALFVAVPARERAPMVPIVPLYFFYALAHIVPVTVGYANWLSLRLTRKRLFSDHYQEDASLERNIA